MINVSFKKEGLRLTLTVDGHAGAAPKGEDLVCAMVSSYAHLWEQNFRESHSEWLTKYDSRMDEGHYYSEIMATPWDLAYVMLLADAILEGFQLAADSFPEFVEFNRQ